MKECSPSPEKAETVRNLINSLESVFFIEQAKGTLAVTLLGLKPATEFDLGSPIKDADGKEVYPGVDIQEVVAVVESLGYSIAYKKEDIEIGYYFLNEDTQKVDEAVGTMSKYSVVVADKKKTADRIMEIFNGEDLAHEEHREVGALLGIPDTAIDAFIRYKAGDEEAFLPREQRPKGEFMAFLYFGLSKDHWQEEIKIAKQYAAAVKALSPDLYNQIVTDYQQTREILES